MSAGCVALENGAESPAARPAELHRIAAEYAQTGDLNAAKAALAKLNLANPSQVLLLQAEQEANANAARPDVEQLANLAAALGARSQALVAYLAPTTTAPTELPPTATPPPAPTASPVPTQVLATATPVASPTPAATATQQPTATAARPQVRADGIANLRSGPATAYPVIGQMVAGQVLAILARTAASDWWRVEFAGQGQAWVSGRVVTVSGGDKVAVAQNIPPLPATATPVPPSGTPVPAQPTATAVAARPSVQYIVKDLHLRPVGVDGQVCGGGGNHNIWVYVIDPAGNRLDGVRVHEIFTNSINVTGAQGKGAGTALWDIYRGGGGQVEIVDGGGNRISDVSRGMSDDWPDVDLLWAGGYCGCKPYPDIASCQAGVDARDYTHFPIGHYVFEVTFQRTY